MATAVRGAHRRLTRLRTSAAWSRRAVLGSLGGNRDVRKWWEAGSCRCGRRAPLAAAVGSWGAQRGGGAGTVGLPSATRSRRAFLVDWGRRKLRGAGTVGGGSSVRGRRRQLREAPAAGAHRRRRQQLWGASLVGLPRSARSVRDVRVGLRRQQVRGAGTVGHWPVRRPDAL